MWIIRTKRTSVTCSLMSLAFVITLNVFMQMLLLPTVETTSMYYKKLQGEKYEPDWVAVSSTVIPLLDTKLGVGVGLRAGALTKGNGDVTVADVQIADEYYKRAYFQHFNKKHTKIGIGGAQVLPGTLITGKTVQKNDPQ